MQWIMVEFLSQFFFLAENEIWLTYNLDVFVYVKSSSGCSVLMF